MLPFDNKNEFQVVIDMPEGTTLERTAVVDKEIAQYLATRPEVVNYQTYVGTSAPITFNGLVRHYDLRGGSNVADIQVNLTDKHDRSDQSHDIAKLLSDQIFKRLRQNTMPMSRSWRCHQDHQYYLLLLRRFMVLIITQQIDDCQSGSKYSKNTEM